MENNVKDLVIVGGGPAGLSAAIYGKRAMLNEVVIEKDIYSCGQIAVTDRVDNYLGLYGESGYGLAMKFKEHAKKLEVPFLEGEVVNIKDGDVKELELKTGDKLYTKAVFIATGSRHRMLKCKGEEKLIGAGVSYCATCDGGFFRNKKVAVVGGGEVALQDALYLSNICEKVYLIHRRNELRASKNLQNKVTGLANIELLLNCEVEEIVGDSVVEAINIIDKTSGKKDCIQASGVFIAIGMEPGTEIVKGVLELDKSGYIITDDSCRCSLNGFYAIGDVRTKQLRQLVTAVADGAVAISSYEQDNLI